MKDSPQEGSGKYSCPHLVHSQDLIKHLDQIRKRFLSQGRITPRMQAIMEKVGHDSAKNLCTLLRNTAAWNPAIGDVIDRAVADLNMGTLDDHIKLKNESEIVRGINGVSGEPEKDSMILPHIQGLDLNLTEEDQIAIGRFLRDLDFRLSRVGTEYYHRGKDKSDYQKRRYLFEITRGWIDPDECENWNKNRGLPYPFPVSGALKVKNTHATDVLKSFNPILIYFGSENLLDRSIFTFMDSMMPPMLKRHRDAAEISPNKFAETIPKGYFVGNFRGKNAILFPEKHEELEQILPMQSIALPEALILAWGMEHLPPSIKHEYDFIEAQIFGGVNMTHDVHKIEVSQKIYQWLQAAINSDDLVQHFPDVPNYLKNMFQIGKICPFNENDV